MKFKSEPLEITYFTFKKVAMMKMMMTLCLQKTRTKNKNLSPLTSESRAEFPGVAPIHSSDF